MYFTQGELQLVWKNTVMIYHILLSTSKGLRLLTTDVFGESFGEGLKRNFTTLSVLLEKGGTRAPGCCPRYQSLKNNQQLTSPV